MLHVQSHITTRSIKKKNRADRATKLILRGAGIISASFILLIIIIVAAKGISPFIVEYEGYNSNTGTILLPRINIITFITGNQWLNGPLGGSSDYAIGFAIVNTIIAVILATLFTLPVALMTALLIAKIAPPKFASVLRTVVELLASIPSIVYGVIGLGVIAPVVSDFGILFGFQTAAGLSLLSTIIVLFMMTLPTITAVAESSIRAVKNEIIEGSLALAASPMQTYFKVVLTSAKSGIFAGVILGVGRALGEATAVSMVSGNAFSGITLNVLATTSTLTSRMLLGLKETTGLDYDARFSVALILMIVILVTNTLLKFVMKRVGKLDEN